MVANTKKSPAPTSPSLADALKGTRGDFSATIKDWAGFVRTVPSSVAAPTELVERYFGVREQSLARRRRTTLEIVDAAPKVRLPRRGAPRRSRSSRPSDQDRTYHRAST